MIHNYQLSFIAIEMPSQRNSDFTYICIHKSFGIQVDFKRDPAFIKFMTMTLFHQTSREGTKQTGKKIHNIN